MANSKFRVSWDVLGKFCGNKANIFIIKMRKNRVIVTGTLPFLAGRMNFISCAIFFIKVIINCFLTFSNLLNGINKNNKKNKLNKLFIFKIEDEGSNMENKLFIIFKIYCWIFYLWIVN